MTNWLTFHLQTNVLFLKMDPCLIVLFRIHRESHVSSCSHTYENGYVYLHAVNKNGGCTVTRYSAKICTKMQIQKNMVKYLQQHM